jgi:hypothetical protein
MTTRALLALFIATSLALLFAANATAQEAGGVEEKFYNFDDMLIDGDFKTPEGMYENARQKARFERSSRLKKSFLDKIQESAQEDALDGQAAN